MEFPVESQTLEDGSCWWFLSLAMEVPLKTLDGEQIGENPNLEMDNDWEYFHEETTILSHVILKYIIP